MSLNDEIDDFVFLDDDCVSSNSVEGTPPDTKGLDPDPSESSVTESVSTPIEPSVIETDSIPDEPNVIEPVSTPIDPSVIETDSTPSEYDDILIFDTPMLGPINITPSCSPAMLSQPSPIEEPDPLVSGDSSNPLRENLDLQSDPVFDDDIIVFDEQTIDYLSSEEIEKELQNRTAKLEQQQIELDLQQEEIQTILSSLLQPVSEENQVSEDIEYIQENTEIVNHEEKMVPVEETASVINVEIPTSCQLTDTPQEVHIPYLLFSEFLQTSLYKLIPNYRYSADWIKSDAHIQNRLSLLQEIPENGRILELGVRSGHSAAFWLFFHPTVQVTVVDGSDHKDANGAIYRLQKWFPTRLTIYQKDWSNVWPKEKYHLIHLHDGEQEHVLQAALRKAWKYTEPNGIWVVYQPKENHMFMTLHVIQKEKSFGPINISLVEDELTWVMRCNNK